MPAVDGKAVFDDASFIPLILWCNDFASPAHLLVWRLGGFLAENRAFLSQDSGEGCLPVRARFPVVVFIKRFEHPAGKTEVFSFRKFAQIVIDQQRMSSRPVSGGSRSDDIDPEKESPHPAAFYHLFELRFVAQMSENRIFSPAVPSASMRPSIARKSFTANRCATRPLRPETTCPRRPGPETTESFTAR